MIKKSFTGDRVGLQTCSTLFVCGLASSFAATAQDNVAYSGGNTAIEEVIVTAQRREQALTDVPVSMAAFSGEQLSNAGIDSTEDLVVLTPSISFNKHIAPFQNTLRIRGVGTNVAAPTIESSISMVVDGVVMARQATFFTDLIDIAAIEVLRGPQSTLFGKNAVGGLLNVTTKKPNLDEVEGAVEVVYDTEYQDLKIRGTVSGPITPELGYRLTGSYLDEGDSVVKNINPDGPKLEDGSSEGVRGTLFWQPSDDMDVRFIADYRDSEGPNGVRVPTRFESQAVENLYDLGPVSDDNRNVNINGGALGRNDYSNQDWGASLEFNIGMGDHTFTSITAYREWALDAFLDIDGIARTVTPSGYDDAVIVDGQVVVSGRMPLTGDSYIWNYLDSSQLSQEFRITSPDDQPFRYIAGLFYWQTDMSFDQNRLIRVCPLNSNVLPPNPADGDPGALTGTCVVPPPAGVSVGARNIFDIDTDYLALYGQIDWDFAEQWVLSAGLRVQREDFEYRVTGRSELREVDAASLPLPAVVTTADWSDSEKESDTITTGKISLTYQPADGQNFYAAYARGYKGIGIDAEPGLNSIHEALEAEYVDSYEVGYKGLFMDNRLNLNVALFHQEFEDLQDSAFNAATATLSAINAGSSRQRGMELDLIYQVNDSLNVTFSTMLLDAEYEEFDGAACYAPRIENTNCQYTATGVGSQDISGEQQPFSPDWSSTLGVSYFVPFGSEGQGVTLRGDYRYIDEQISLQTQDPHSKIPAYGIFNFRATYTTSDQALAVTVFVDNVFDESYPVNRRVYNYSGFPSAVGNTRADVFAKDSVRVVGAGVRYSF